MDYKNKGDDQVEVELSEAGEQSPDPAIRVQDKLDDSPDQTVGKSNFQMNTPQEQQLRLEHINVQQLDGAGGQNIRSDEGNFNNGQETFKNNAFQHHCCFGKVCTYVRRIFNVIGCLLALPNSALDLAYIAKSTFYNQAFFVTLIVLLLLRIAIILGVFQANLLYQLGYKPGLSTATVQEDLNNSQDNIDEDGKRSRKYQQVRKQGLTLYLSMNSLMLIGTFRVLPSQYFPKEICFGYAIELIFNLFPTFLVQMFNNTDMPGLLTGIQSTSLAIKMFLILNFFIEIILIIYEIVLYRRMKKLQIEGYQKVNEEERRRMWSRKVGLLGLVSAFVWLIVLIICLAASDSRKCDARHAMETGVCVECVDPHCMQCHQDSDKCQMCPPFLNGSALFLSQTKQCRQCDIGCNKCIQDADASKCSECQEGFYLSQGKYCKQCLNVGCLQCEDKDATTGTQQCAQCADNYFMKSTDKLCYKCNDGCESCTDNGSGVQQCTSCKKGFFLTDVTKACEPCTENCALCVDDGSSGQTCKACIEGFSLDAQKSCANCSIKTTTDDCGVCNENECIECKRGFYLDNRQIPNTCNRCSEEFVNCNTCKLDDNGQPKCLTCDTNIAEMDSLGQCLKCNEGWELGRDISIPGGRQCYCNEILNIQEGYKCQTCEDTIQDCKTCKYTLEPANRLQSFVGQWNDTHSAKKGTYMDPAENPVGSQHIICKQPGPGLVKVPIDGVEVIKRCEEVFKGCKKCAEVGLSCDTCDIAGWYRYRSGANYRCGKCHQIPNRPGMEFCDECNEFVCDRCKPGYHKLMGGCFKCYFDWQCDYFD